MGIKRDLKREGIEIITSGGNRRLHPGVGDSAAVPAHLCGEHGETWGIQKRRH